MLNSTRKRPITKRQNAAQQISQYVYHQTQCSGVGSEDEKLSCEYEAAYQLKEEEHPVGTHLVRRYEKNYACESYSLNDDPGFITLASRPEPLAFVTYPDNPLLKKKKLSILDAVSNDFIITSHEIGYSAMLERRLADRGINLDPVMDIGSVEAIIRIIRGGYGVAFLPRYVIADHVERKALVTLDIRDPGIDMNSYFLCSSERWINPVMKVFIRIVNMVESYHE